MKTLEKSMRMRLASFLGLSVLLFMICSVPALAANYEIKKVSNSVYAAIALPAGKAASNAMIIVTENGVILAGAHFVPDGIRELLDDIAKITSAPLREVILTHHHSGYNYIDLDLPVDAEIITSWQTWQALNSEYRKVKNPITFFERNLTLQRGKLSVILKNTNKGHTSGDVIVYIPGEGVLFTSDLVFNGVVGYMGSGYMRDWMMNLDLLESIGAATVIPGLGDVTDSDGIKRFHDFARDFLTEVLRHVERGDNLAETKKGFLLPQYKDVPGYRTYFNVNVERAYAELKEDEMKNPPP